MARNFGVGFEADVEDIDIKAMLVLANLQKGDIINVGSRTIEFQNLQKDGFTWLVNAKRKKVLFKFGGFHGTMGRGFDYIDGILRDISGILMVDHLNVYNPFHVESDCMKILKRDESFKE